MIKKYKRSARERTEKILEVACQPAIANNKPVRKELNLHHVHRTPLSRYRKIIFTTYYSLEKETDRLWQTPRHSIHLS
jgi:hypothetical protein